MLHWSLLNEYYSFCILLILFIRCALYERSSTQSAERKLYTKCLLLSMAFIILNVLCVISLEHPAVVPIWISFSLNTLYFFMSIIVCSLYAYLMFMSILKHVYDKFCLIRAKVMLLIVTSLSTILIVANIFTGLVFKISSEGVYERGPLNRLYYFFLITEVLFLCICFFKNRRSVSDTTIYVIRSAPIIIVLICGVQFLFPEVLLNGTICAIVSLMIFIAFRSNTEEQDSLTSAGSRRAFMEELGLRSGGGQSIHIIQIAILNISELNARYNHFIGDACLYEVANCLKHALPHIQVFRTGGATFTMMLPYTDDFEAEKQLRTVCDKLNSGIPIGAVKCNLVMATAELCYENLSADIREIVDEIEYTMQLAKKSATPVRFDRVIKDDMDKKSSLLRLIRSSIDKKRFEVHYQPIYCCHKDIFCSAEALLRLKDYNGTQISPDVFIPLAEENGMIEELTWYVLEDICKTISSEKLPGLQSISINLSMKQLLDPTLPSQIKARLEKYKVSPDRIKVEMTERFLLHDSNYARIQMEALARIGIEIYMDDFGTGYSNLSNVLEFPFSFIKLDRSLIIPIANNVHAKAMVSSVIALFHGMNKKVIAEGVEEEDQVRILKELGIDMIQGFHFAKPSPSSMLTEYFSDEHK